MYELNRDAEQERLFHSAMFDLSELKHTSAAHAARTDSLERAVKACASHHDNERPVSLAGGKHVEITCDSCQANLHLQYNPSSTL